MSMIEIDRDTLRDFERAAALEWLETDGLGGWAGSTLSGAHSRRDHHLLRAREDAAVGPADAAEAGGALPGATVALAKLDEMVIENGRVHELSCNRFPFFVAAPGVRHLAGFRRDLFPVFEYATEGYRLRKTIALVESVGAAPAAGNGALLVLYEVLAAPGPFVLALRPFFARREPHALCRADLHGATPAVLRAPAGLRLRWSSGAEIFLAVAAELEERPDWWYRFELEEERRRGLDFQEDLWTPGLLRRELTAGDRFGLVVSAGAAAGAAAGGALELLAPERRRREQLLDRLPVQDELTRILALAADQFSLRRAGGARLLASGYPGGEEAAADSLIALPGVLLATGRGDEAGKLLRACTRAADGGAPPDRLPEGAEWGRAGEAAPGSLDDSLWLFVAAWRYLQATGDEALVRDALLPALLKIAAAHARGAPSGLRAAADGLLEAAPGSPAAALRPGKAVEINALWHNALATLAALGGRLGDAALEKAWRERARRVQRRYAELFWNPGQGCLYDSVHPAGEAAAGVAGAGRADGAPRAAGADGAHGGACPALRAHQVLAIGLPFPALSKQRAQRLLRTLEERLSTPVGLRDLALSEEAAAAPSAAAAITGTPRQEEDHRPGRPRAGSSEDHRPGWAREGRSDLAWPWLLGPLLAAQVWLRGDAGRRQALQLVAELDPLLSCGAIGTIAELVGVEPPHAPAGHTAHAASVGELLRVYVEELHPATPTKGRRQLEPRSKAKPKAKPKVKPAAGSRPASGRGRGRKATPER
jgi:predicted glycogen debranching enzyme